MTRLSFEQRKARDAAFAQMMEAETPSYLLRQQIIGARVRAGLTQRELAGRMRTSQPTIARIETGGRTPSLKTLQNLARITGSRLIIRLEPKEEYVEMIS